MVFAAGTWGNQECKPWDLSDAYLDLWWGNPTLQHHLELHNEKNALYGAFDKFHKHQQVANAQNLAYIEHVYTLKGFLGITGPSHHTHTADHALTMFPGLSGELETYHILEKLSEQGGVAW